MRICEVTEAAVDPSLAAVAEFIKSRQEDVGAELSMNLDAFINMLHSNGINISKDKLRNVQPSLKNLIANITDNEVIFKGAGEVDAPTMTVDKAKDTVEKMAKRALPNELK